MGCPFRQKRIASRAKIVLRRFLPGLLWWVGKNGGARTFRQGDFLGMPAYQEPVFGMDAQGSCTGLGSPRCSNSMEMLSGVLTKAILPSRGGRLMVTPASISFRQVS